MPRQIIAGEAGSAWTNGGDKVQYQLIVTWHNSCAVCIQFDHQIGPYWPIPFHRSCGCRQEAVYPGGTAEPFVDYRDKIRELSPSRQADVMGVSNLAMVESGLVTWDDVVTSGRIRSFREVVDRKGLTVEQMTAAGVRKDLAIEAREAVNTAAHTRAEQARHAAVKAILDAGYSHGQIKAAASAMLAARVAASITPPPVAPPPKPSSSPEEDEAGHRAKLAKVVGWLRRLFGITPKGD